MTESGDVSAAERAFRWVFEDRTTGRILVAQMPNLVLWLFLATWAVGMFAHPSGAIGTIVRLVEMIALTFWAADEVIRGVNPWRRFLGGTALAYVLFAIIKH